MSIIHASSQIAKANLLPVNSINFPALKHFFPCNEATNAVTLVDSIGGLNVQDFTLTAIINNGDGTLDVSAGAFSTIISGTVANPGSKNVLLIWGGKPTAAAGANINFGSIATPGTTCGVLSTAQTGTGGKISADGSVTLTVTNATKLAGTGAQLQTRALSCIWHTASVTGVMQEYDYDGTTCNARSSTIASGTASDSLTGMSTHAMNQGVSITAGSYPGFVQMWHFTTMPTAIEIQAALAWTHYYAFVDSGHRKLAYPAWAGRT